MSLELFAPELLALILRYVRGLPEIFTVSKKVYYVAYDIFTRRLVLEEHNPLREVYIRMLSIRQYADDLQLRFQRNALFSQIEARMDRTERNREEWLLYIEDDEEERLEEERLEEERLEEEQWCSAYG